MIIDTNIFLEVLLKQNKHEEFLNFLNDLMIGKKRGILSSFIIDSVVINMERSGSKSKEIEIFLKKIIAAEGLKIYNIGMKDRINALSFIEKYNLDYDDALVVQTAIATNSKEILSLDGHFDKVKELKRIVP